MPVLPLSEMFPGMNRIPNNALSPAERSRFIYDILAEAIAIAEESLILGDAEEKHPQGQEGARRRQ